MSKPKLYGDDQNTGLYQDERYNKTLALRVSERQLERINLAAKRSGSDRSALVRLFIDRWISESGELLLPEPEDEPTAPGWRDEVRQMIRDEIRTAKPKPPLKAAKRPK